MKILMVSYSGYGAWFTLRLQEEGHKVDYYLMEKKYADVLSGLAPEPMFKRPDFAKYDLVLFDLTGKPKLAEQSMELTSTMGDGNFNSLVEEDRMFGIETMEQCDINVPPYEVFQDIGEAKKYIAKTKKRFVFKPDGGQDQDCNTTYVATSADDLLNYIDRLGAATNGATFLLQEVVDGIEISTEAYFNGDEFFLWNATLEEKKFMEGNKGPNTGCAGNLVWIYNKPNRLINEGLMRMKDFLKQVGYRGMIDLNVIAGPDKLYGLEWTPRFGYDASATLCSLITSDLGEFFHAIAAGDIPTTLRWNENAFAAATRLSIPPYPTEVPGKHPAGVPINGIELDDISRGCYLYDAMLVGDELVTAGASGFVAVPIGVGRSIDEAWAVVKEKIKCLKLPDAQYRQDLARRTWKRYEGLARWGWFK